MSDELDNKYVVLKRKDVEPWVENGYLRIPTLDGDEDRIAVLDDAVVIRTGDIFATSGLYGYAYNIETQIELLNRRNIQSLTDAEAAELAEMEATREYFAARAMEAEQRLLDGTAKVPD